MAKSLTDNMQSTPLVDLGLESRVEDLLRIADIDIGNLNDDNGSSLLVFPDSFEKDEEEIGNKSIIHLHLCDKTISTGNIMGFVGVNDTNLSIKSRFAKNDGEDYFLHYLLLKVFNINLFDLKHTISSESIFDFLIYMFPFFLKKAMRQGVYKSYIRHEYNDANVKGAISTNRHIKLNIPFRGTIAYNTREHSYDNYITQLIRHTIEYIKGTYAGKRILKCDTETMGCVAQICSLTPSYCFNQRRTIIAKNVRPMFHPYYLEYTALQRICIQILRHESIKYGHEKNKVYGILFDGAWLWEEYLNTVLSRLKFNHAQNKRHLGGIGMFVSECGGVKFENKGQTMYPDFYTDDIVLDAKYKHLNGVVGRDDLYQVVSYMYCMNKRYGGYVYPNDSNNKMAVYKLSGIGSIYDPVDSGGLLYVIPFDVPQNTNSWDSFAISMTRCENQVLDGIRKLINPKS